MVLVIKEIKTKKEITDGNHCINHKIIVDTINNMKKIHKSRWLSRRRNLYQICYILIKRIMTSGPVTHSLSGFITIHAHGNTTSK